MIATFALQTDHVFTNGGEVQTVDLKRLDDSFLLEQQALPDQKVWEKAVANAQSLFGLEGGDYRSADNLNRLFDKVRTGAADEKDSVGALREQLLEHKQKLGVDDDCDRMKTAEAAASLIGKIGAATAPLDVVAVMADVDIPTSPKALMTSIATAGDVATAISETKWDFVDRAAELSGRGKAIKEELSSAAAADDFAKSLAPTLRTLLDEAQNIVLAQASTTTPTPPATSMPAKSAQVSRADAETARAELDEVLGSLSDDQTISISWEIHDS